MTYRIRGLSGFSTRASKRRSILRNKRKARTHTNSSSTGSSADATASSLGNAESTLTTLFAATSLTRTYSKNGSDIVKKKQRTQTDGNSREHAMATSAASLLTPNAISTNNGRETGTAEKLSEMHPSVQTEYAAMRKQCPDLPEDPGLRAGILLLVTDSGGEVKIGKCDGEPGCETPVKLGSLKRRKKCD